MNISKEALEIMKEYRQNLDKANSLLNEAKKIISDLTDSENCSFDHNGFCQSHGCMSSKNICPHQKAKEFLQKFI